LEESVHEGDVAVVDADGRLIAFAGDPDRAAYARSSMKPLQASVSLSLSSVDYADREVSVMCASHNAESVHIEAVRAILSRAGVPEGALQCPAALPWDEASLVEAPVRLAVNSDCSGKHAGMLGAARAQGWDMETYRSPNHPLQTPVLAAVRSASGFDDVTIGVDGCGIAVHGMPLRALATIYARLASPERLGSLEVHARRAVAAMISEPYMVAGRNRVDTAVMRALPGIVVKSGAEALACASIPNRGLGIAVKIADGSSRGSGPALIRTLDLLDMVGSEVLTDLDAFAAPSVLGGGQPVGRATADFTLVRAEADRG
jgi:L-asparaginase II